MAIRLITAPMIEPISLIEAKSHLRVDHSTDDSIIAIYIAAAREDCEKWTARAFISQTWELVLDKFPEDEVLLPKPPLQSIVSIKYDDGAGVEQTLSVDQYTIDNVSEPGWVVPSPSGWGVATFEGINSIRIRFIAGYGDTSNLVPFSIKAAILLHLGRLYENREDVIVGTVASKLPIGNVEYLLRPYRVALGMA